jgi:hypothetical protein
MRLVKFSMPDQMDAWEALESTDGVTVEGVYRFDSYVVVKYSIQDERTDRERETLEHLKTWADNLKEDKVLPTLKNAVQRELYLLERYNIDSSTSGKVWEYLKMREKKNGGENGA